MPKRLRDELVSLLSCVLGDGAKHTSVIITEPSGPLRSVTITNLKDGDLILNLDEGRRMVCKKNTCGGIGGFTTPLFNRSPKVFAHRMADGAAIRVYDNNNVDIAIFDLKGGKRQGVREQLRSAHCFLEYVNVVLEAFHSVGLNLSKVEYVVITDKGHIPTKMPVGYKPLSGFGIGVLKIVAVSGASNSVPIDSILYV